jgi:hypothetical protein
MLANHRKYRQLSVILPDQIIINFHGEALAKLWRIFDEALTTFPIKIMAI